LADGTFARSFVLSGAWMLVTCTLDLFRTTLPFPSGAVWIYPRTYERPLQPLPAARPEAVLEERRGFPGAMLYHTAF